MGSSTDKTEGTAEGTTDTTSRLTILASTGIFILLFLSAFQTFVGAKTYELGADRAYQACIARSSAAATGECEALRPFWDRYLNLHGSHLAQVLTLTKNGAVELWDDARDATDRISAFLAQRARASSRLAN